jgi:hypothetical protein
MDSVGHGTADHDVRETKSDPSATLAGTGFCAVCPEDDAIGTSLEASRQAVDDLAPPLAGWLVRATLQLLLRTMGTHRLLVPSLSVESLGHASGSSSRPL